VSCARTDRTAWRRHDIVNLGAKFTVANADLEERNAEAVDRFVRAWETGDMGLLVSMLAEDAMMSMPPWLGWLDGREAIAAALAHPQTWDGEPRPGRYRLLPVGMNTAATEERRAPIRERALQGH
jgi:hypothetical protein